MKRIVAISLIIFVLVVGSIFVSSLLSSSTQIQGTTPTNDYQNQPIVTEKTNTPTNTATNNNTTTQNTTGPKTYSLTQVANHNRSSDCWTIVQNKVYDVSKYLNQDVHPAGSDAIIPYCGKDTTTAMETKGKREPQDHSQEAYSILNQYYIGNLQ